MFNFVQSPLYLINRANKINDYEIDSEYFDAGFNGRIDFFL
jgi:hypothetical protein